MHMCFDAQLNQKILDGIYSRSLHDELYQAAKRSSHPHMTINESPSNEIDGQDWIVDEK